MQRAQTQEHTTVNVFIVFFTRRCVPAIGPGIALNVVGYSGCAKYLLSDEYLMSSSSSAPRALPHVNATFDISNGPTDWQLPGGHCVMQPLNSYPVAFIVHA